MENIKLEAFDINTFDINSNYSISASAGTGKTYSMINIVKKLVEKGVNSEKILVVTYTEKAAGELKDRIKDEIKEKNADKIHIGTIHSFCKETIDEFYMTMGLPCKLNVVDNSKINRLYGKFIRDELYNGNISIDLVNTDKKEKYIKDIIDKLILNKNYEIEPNIISFAPYSKFDELMNKENIASLKGKSKEEVIEYFINFNDENNKESEEEVKYVFGCFNHTSKEYTIKKNEYDLLKSKPKVTKKALEPYEKYFNDIEKIWNSLYDNIFNKGIFYYNGNFGGDKVKKLKNSLSKIKDHQADDICFYQKAAMKLYKMWQEEKIKNKWFTFNDMLREVREAVVDENCTLKEKLQEKYDYVLIDEFQDTNQLQWDIFNNVFLKSNSNHIIVVGDRKQSIYSFQGADLTVYDNAVKQIIKNGGKACRLPKNYRSSKAVIDAYNSLFLKEEFKSLDYSNDIVKVGKESINAKYKGKDIKGLSIVVKQKEGLDEAVNVSPSEYAYTIIRLISDYCTIENGKTRLQLTYEDEKKEIHYRNVSFKDFKILGKTKSEFYDIEFALKKAGIPFVKYKDDKLFGGLECAHWIALINAILKPDFTGKNRNAFKKALYTKFYGKTLKEISSSKYDTDTCKEMDLMQNWRQYAKDHDYEKLISSILTDSKIEERMNSLTDIQSLNMFKQIGDYALDYLLEGNSLYELKNNLKSLAEGEKETEEGGTIVAKGSDFDCVELMTMHASKGLDGSIVFIVGGYKQENPFISPIGIYHEDNKAYITASKSKYEDEISNEIDRLFYVAYTRAIYHMVVPYYKHNDYVKCIDSIKKMISNKEDTNLYEEVIYEDINIHKIKANIKQIIEVNNQNDNKDFEEKRNNQIEKLKEISGKILKNRVYKHSYASMSKIEENEYVIDGNSNSNKEGNEVEGGLSDFDKSAKYIDLGYDENISYLPIPDKFPKGAVIGTTLHEIFENFKFEDINNANNNLKMVINNRFKANNVKHNDAHDEYVFLMVNNVLKANLPTIKGNIIDKDNTFKLMEVESHNRKAEAEFNFNIDNKILSNYCSGFIDLLFKKGEVYSILDWKSDTINDKDLLSYNKIDDLKKRVDHHYSIQRVLYSYTLIHWLHNFYNNKTLQEIFNDHFGGIYYVFIRGCNEDSFNGIYAQTWNSYNDLKNEFNKIMKAIGVSIKEEK